MLLRDIAARLRGIVSFETISVMLHDPARNVMRLELLVEHGRVGIELGNEFAIEGSPHGLVWETQKSLLIHDVEHETRFPQIMETLRKCPHKSYYVLPLTSVGRRLGAIAFGNKDKSAPEEIGLDSLEQVAKQVAIAVDNALNFQRAQRERDRSQLLLEINNAVVSTLDLEELLRAVSSSLQRLLPHDFADLILRDAESGQYFVAALDYPDHHDFFAVREPITIEGTALESVLHSQRPLVCSAESLANYPADVTMRRGVNLGLISACHVPLVSHNRSLGLLSLACKRQDAFTPEAIELLSETAKQISIAVENSLTFREVEVLRDRLAGEKQYLEEEIQTEYNFEEMVGRSAALKRVLKQVEKVASTDSTVLLQGESGTGKELIARALHNLSTRREHTLVKVNCAAIPTGLLESELFGHEKGAFTGAVAQRIGRFELAHQGTLFLDEVGEIPLELQPKLLRVLQEQEFERVGGGRTIRVNVRLIAATNGDLSQMVAEKKFRSDLYYRLKVFPITLPPLRDRREDIPLLARSFTQKFAHRMNKRIETIRSDAQAALMNYPWPGNVRELENFIERAVILSRGPVLDIPVAELKSSSRTDVQQGADATLESMERDHILRILRETRWVIGGPRGAAARLRMNRSTLNSRLRKLGITRPKPR
ncbi:MAG: sigma 54-interacting transcriptional regulator [Acidobacteria bacterium]|nr:sigma 54-interacting transcriptional regulator [Acidobacteriota bacterium]